MTNRVYIAEWGPLGEGGEVIGVYAEEDHAVYAATAKLDEETMKEIHSAPVQGHHTWEDEGNWASVTGYWIE